MLYQFKTALVSYSPADMAPVVFPEMFEPDETTIDQAVMSNEPVEFEFGEMDMSLEAAEDIIGRFFPSSQ